MGNEKVCSLRMDCGPYSWKVRCCVRVGEGLSDKYKGKVGVYRGLCSVHSPLLSCLMLSQSGWEGSSCLPLQGNG